jgi:transcription-repair coupling factor (superfamily II helicase)
LTRASSSALAPPPSSGVPRQRWGQLYGSAVALALAQAARKEKRLVLAVTSSTRSAEQLHAELGFFTGDALPTLLFPDWETLPYDVFSPAEDLISQRLATLYRLPRLENGIVVAAVGTLLQRLPPRAYVEGGSLLIELGQSWPLGDARRLLDEAGYAFVSEVGAHGEYAVRGSILDVFPMGSAQPYRIELIDDAIETIRGFDPETQRSREQCDRVELLPGREIPLGESAVRLFRSNYRKRFEGDPKRSQIYRNVSAGVAPGGIEYYLPLFFESTATLFDYLPPSIWIAELGDARAAAEQSYGEIETRHAQLAHDIERPVLAPAEAFITPQQLSDALERHERVHVESFELATEADDAAAHNFETAPAPRLAMDGQSEQPLHALDDFLLNLDGRALLVAESPGRRELLAETLRANGTHPVEVTGWDDFLRKHEPVCITVSPIERGLVLPDAGIALIVEEQLVGERARQRARRRPDRDPEAIIRDLTDLRAGAPVVHEEYGIGRFIGLTTLEAGGATNEFLTLEYAGGDRLYVPVHALHLVTRYTGASPESAPLHKLGSDQWKKARARAAKRIRDVAAELLDLYARRAARQGHRYNVDERELRLFEAAFPFDETPDQHQAIEQVLGDMRAAQPMDRLVCGDVGFGKTEVAMRAAFVALQDGRQCAILVPTTLLAQQHYQTFRDRFADWPARIEVLSRFRSGAESQRVIEDLADGRVDIVIGTQKLVQSGVRFKNLGLVIIDEEHRFGVRDKERLKSLRAEVDVLTLTATPIPRTLNMAMGGLRDLSLITTPPEERLAIKTFVSDWNPSLVREACLRELKRGGQIYFVHNEVETIDAFAATLAELVPEASIRIAHGQMRERELERVMLDFYHRRFSVLVCTTIIESGIDVPTANTMLVNRADRFGLAQLHQLRGRVGRSHHRAYAYLIAPPREQLTPDAVKRLEAIESLEALGVGFVLATHDLEIRGAGELLGAEQSGQIQEIGFALYTELLQRAVAALRAGTLPDLESAASHGPEIELRVVALLPEEYMPDVHMRLVLYKRIASAEDLEALRTLQVEMIDRFGLLPDPAKTLFALTELKLAAARLGVAKIDAGPKGGRIEFRPDAPVDPLSLVRVAQSAPRDYRLDGSGTLRFTASLDDPDERIKRVGDLLRRIAPRTAPPPA